MAVNRLMRGSFAACLLLCVLARGAVAEHISIVATVNDDVITSTDLDERRALVLQSANLQPTPENLQRVTPRVLQVLVDEALEMQEAKKQSITISDAEVDKTLDGMGESKGQAPGTLKKLIESKGLSLRSLKTQIRASLAWNKVVQRKLRRNVTISKDEVLRAQQAQAADPGSMEERVTALILPITSPDKAEHVQALANEIATALKNGQDLSVLATRYTVTGDGQMTPPTWVEDEHLPNEVIQALHALKPGETSAPIRIGNEVQFVKLLETRTIKKSAGSTEVMIKQLSVDVPPNPKKPVLAKLTETEHTLRANPGSCEDEKLPPTPMPVDVKFARLKLSELNTDQRTILMALNVGDVSEPLISPGKLRMVLLCERMEGNSNTADLDALRQKLFAEKMELEAQKHLRNLRRDATIDIRSDK